MRADVLNSNSGNHGDLTIVPGVKLESFEAEVTLTAGAVAVSDQAVITCPTGFIALGVQVEDIKAVTAAVSLQDVGPVADPDGFLDGVSGINLNSTGNKGTFMCNGIASWNGAVGSPNTAETADEIRVTLSGNATGTAPADNGLVKLTFFGLTSIQ